jgi:hypothetical protein
MIKNMPSNEKLFIGGDLNGHVGTIKKGFEMVHVGFGYGDQNQEEEEILNFAVLYDLMAVNTFFKKKKSHLVIFNIGQHSNQIDSVLTRREERPNCVDCKVIPDECVVPQHKLVVADFRS